MKPNPHRGRPHTEETKRKIGNANRKPKPPRSPKHLRRISQALRGLNNPNYGKRFSEQTKQRMRAAHAHASNGRRGTGRPGRTSWNKGKTLSAKHRKHISEARKGKPHPHK